MSETHLSASPSELHAWTEDGFFLRRGVFSAEEIEAIRKAAEQVVQRVSRAVEDGHLDDDYRIDGNRYVETCDSTVQFEHLAGSVTVRVVEPFHHFHPHLDALLDDPRIVEPMKGLVGSERVAVWTDKLNLKRPREGSGFRWHQDSPYWTHACDHVDRLPNVMLALDDATEENGCFRVVRGSHQRGCLPGIHDESVLGPLFTDPAHFEVADQVAAEMPAGSLFFFNPHTVHGSEPNRSDAPRRAMVLTYQPAGFRQFKVDSVRDAGA